MFWLVSLTSKSYWKNAILSGSTVLNQLFNHFALDALDTEQDWVRERRLTHNRCIRVRVWTALSIQKLRMHLLLSNRRTKCLSRFSDSFETHCQYFVATILRTVSTLNCPRGVPKNQTLTCDSARLRGRARRYFRRWHFQSHGEKQDPNSGGHRSLFRQLRCCDLAESNNRNNRRSFCYSLCPAFRSGYAASQRPISRVPEHSITNCHVNIWKRCLLLATLHEAELAKALPIQLRWSRKTLEIVES